MFRVQCFKPFLCLLLLCPVFSSASEGEERRCADFLRAWPRGVTMSDEVGQKNNPRIDIREIEQGFKESGFNVVTEHSVLKTLERVRILDKALKPDEKVYDDLQALVTQHNNVKAFYVDGFRTFADSTRQYLACWMRVYIGKDRVITLKYNYSVEGRIVGTPVDR